MPDPNPAKFPTASGRRKGRIALLLFGGALLMAGCRPKPAGAGVEAQVTVRFDPSPPAAGATALKITLADSAGRPIRLGHLDVEGDMSHAGMKPVFTQLEETAPGTYAGTIEFTMGGDWLLLLSGRFSDARPFHRTIDVPGVKSK
jgi:hypothetical protein